MKFVYRHRPLRIRRGGALLLLIVALLLVILGALQALLRGEIASQRNATQRFQSQALIRAIETAQSASVDWSTPVVLPVNEADDETIIVKANEDKTELTATWLVQDQVIRTMTRTMNMASNSQDSKPNSENQ